MPILPPPPREQPRSQQEERQREIQKQKEIEKQKQLERQALLEKQKQEMEFEEQRLREIERQKEIERKLEEQKQEREFEEQRLREIERQREIERKLEEQKEFERKVNLERQIEIERQREEERLRLEKEQLERKKFNEAKRKDAEGASVLDAEPERSTSKEEQGKVEVTTFGPFSPFKNFPSFPVNVLENQQEQLELRGPNLLPTKPTGPPTPQPKKSAEQTGGPRGPPAPARPPPSNSNEDQLRFIPSPPLREPVPPVNVFLSAEDEEESPSVFLPPPQPSRPQQNFQNTFFNVQTQLGQTQTRIPPQSETESRPPPPANQPFTFFGGQFQQSPRPGVGPVSFPGQPFQSFSPSPRPSTNQQQFVNFNNFRSPEQPRTLQSVFGSSLPPNTFFNRDARFDTRPTPAQTSPGFNLGPSSSTQRQSRAQSPSFPSPQFGGFRPIKRHLQVSQVRSQITDPGVLFLLPPSTVRTLLGKIRSVSSHLFVSG